MGNCFKGCLAEGKARTRETLNASDSQYEMLIDGAWQRDATVQTSRQTRSKDKSSNFFRKFWLSKTVEYSRLNKANNNFTTKGNNNNHQISGSEIQLQCLDAHSLLLVSKDGNRKTGYNELHTDLTSTPGSSLDLEWENDYGYQGSRWLTQTDDEGTALPNFPATTDAVFKIEEWSTLKKSKDRINALRKLEPGLAGSTAVQRSSSTPDDSASCCDGVPPSLLLMGERPFGTGARPFHQSLNSVGGTIGTPPSVVSCGSYSSHISTPEDSLEWDIDQDRQLKSENESLDFETKELLLEIELLKNRVLNETGANLRDVKLDETIS